MRGGIVPEFHDIRMAIECRLHQASLNATAATVHDANFPQACAGRGMHVFLDDRGHVAGREGMEIDLGLDGDADRIRHVRIFGLRLGDLAIYR